MQAAGQSGSAATLCLSDAEPAMNNFAAGPPTLSAPINAPTFRAPYAPPDEELAAGFLTGAARETAAERRIDTRARALVEAIRAKAGGLGGIEDFLHAYSLST